MTAFKAIWIGILLTLGGTAMAVEEAAYSVIVTNGDYEIRRYAPCVVAEVVVKASQEEAGNLAFRRLFGYISGKNRTRETLAMTAPVSQEPGRKIAMTAPVGQEPAADGGWAVSFMMPAAFTMDTLPEPEDPAVRLRPIPERLMAAVRYSGRWTSASFDAHRKSLEDWIPKNGYKASGPAVWARYNPPFTPSFFRRNEVLILVEPAAR